MRHVFSITALCLRLLLLLLLLLLDSVVRIATHYGLDGSGFEFRWERDFPHPFRRVLSPSTLRMMCVHCSVMWSGWPGSKWRFWTDPFLIVRNAPVIKGTIFVLTSHILLTSLSRTLYSIGFSVYFVLTFELSGMAYRSAVLCQVGLLVLFDMW